MASNFRIAQQGISSFVFIISVLFSFTHLHAQTVPDFTITDSQGQGHTLYADYLNQGKSVMVKIFFTTCPPCIQLAPSMQPLYEDWGAGENDVEFIELSNKSFDTDSRVNNYKATYGITFPGAGSEGGSLEAVMLLTTGELGPFTGTPTFIVIAPDGTFQYDVFGNGISGQIAALDEALLATGAMKPDSMGMDTMTMDTMMMDTTMMDTTAAQPTIVGGNISSISSDINMSNVTVNLYATPESNATLLFSQQSDSIGRISFSIFPDSIAETAVFRATKTGTAARGLSGLDLIVIQKHLLNIEPFTEGYQYLLSDANNTSSTSALDLVEIQKIILGINNSFNNGISWYMLPENVVLEIENNHVKDDYVDYILLKDVLDGSQPLSFKGYKRGDLNGSVNPNE